LRAQYLQQENVLLSSEGGKFKIEVKSYQHLVAMLETEKREALTKSQQLGMQLEEALC
jgi:hypothetical protein